MQKFASRSDSLSCPLVSVFNVQGSTVELTYKIKLADSNNRDMWLTM